MDNKKKILNQIIEKSKNNINDNTFICVESNDLRIKLLYNAISNNLYKKNLGNYIMNYTNNEININIPIIEKFTEIDNTKKLWIKETSITQGLKPLILEVDEIVKTLNENNLSIEEISYSINLINNEVKVNINFQENEINVHE